MLIENNQKSKRQPKNRKEAFVAGLQPKKIGGEGNFINLQRKKDAKLAQAIVREQCPIEK